MHALGLFSPSSFLGDCTIEFGRTIVVDSESVPTSVCMSKFHPLSSMSTSVVANPDVPEELETLIRRSHPFSAIIHPKEELI
jgi:hypothetical protein